MKRATWILTALMLTVTVPALARPGKADRGEEPRGFGRHGPGGPGFGLCRLLKAPELGLTDEQSARLKPLCVAQREKMGSLLQSQRDLRDEVRAELEKDAPDLERVASLNQQVAALHTEMARQHVALRQSVRGELTEQQAAALKRLADQPPAERDRTRGGHGRPDGEGPFGCPFGGPDGPDPEGPEPNAD